MDNTIRDRMLESWEWLEVECDCDNWSICQNHREMAETLGIDPLDLVGILAEIQELE